MMSTAVKKCIDTKAVIDCYKRALDLIEKYRETFEKYGKIAILMEVGEDISLDTVYILALKDEKITLRRLVCIMPDINLMDMIMKKVLGKGIDELISKGTADF